VVGFCFYIDLISPHIVDKLLLVAYWTVYQETIFHASVVLESGFSSKISVVLNIKLNRRLDLKY